MKEEGRIIASDVCVCRVCMNEPHTAEIYMDGDTRLRGRLWTTWSDWKDGAEGVKYRDRIVEFIEVEGLRIPASEVKAWGINGIYTLGHVILDVAPTDEIQLPLDISPFI